jgi:hypothetical protein
MHLKGSTLFFFRNNNSIPGYTPKHRKSEQMVQVTRTQAPRNNHYSLQQPCTPRNNHVLPLTTQSALVYLPYKIAVR